VIDNARVKHAALLLACSLTLCAPLTLAQPTATDAAERAPASFDIRIEAPEEVRTLLDRHLELQRYREVSDLDASELERLLVLARQDAAQLLGTLGYFSAQIDIRQEPGGSGRPVIAVYVAPGPLTAVGAVDLRFHGEIAQAEDPDARAQRRGIEADWQLKSGRRFSQSAWEEAKTQALRQLLARRYPAGRISDSLAEVDPDTHRADLRLTLDSGPLYRLGPLQVTGLQRYDPALLRLTGLTPGEVYDQRKLLEAQQRLTASGYFDSAYLSVEPGADPAAAPVNVQLREAKAQKVVMGLGFATDSGPRLSLEHVHNQMPLLGWRAQTKLQLDRKSPFAQTQWTSLPNADLWRWVGALRLDRQDDGTLVTDTQRWRMGRTQTGERIDRNIYLQYDRSMVQGIGETGASASATGEGASLSMHYAWTRRAFDSLPFPSRGHALSAEAGAGTTLEGQRQPYLRGLGRWTGIVPLGADDAPSQALRARLALRLEGGAVGARREAQIPSAQLFRAGGDTSVRGYGLREIGLPLANGSTGPGRYMGTGSIEWQQPLRRQGVASAWEGTLFVDAGDVAERADQLGRALAVGLGSGLRWKSPVGPLQVDLAYGVKVQTWRLHLSVGWVF
jgi:translocation and assembly module TamA